MRPIWPKLDSLAQKTFHFHVFDGLCECSLLKRVIAFRIYLYEYFLYFFQVM